MIYRVIAINIVANTYQFLAILAPRSLNTVLKLIVFGGKKRSAVKVPKKLDLNVVLSSSDSGET